LQDVFAMSLGQHISVFFDHHQVLKN